MRISRAAEGLVVHAPAKLNLFFEVLGKRADGYHEIETLMCPIGFYDSLYFREEPSGRLELKCEAVAGSAGTDGNGPSKLPQGRDNLVLRAVELLRERAGVASGASLRLVKRIPVAAGLGGGSSDAAAALVAANQGWRLGWPTVELVSLAAELGSDVPFFLAGGPAICRGRGEQVARVEGFGALRFVVVCPPAGLLTAAVYGACQPAAKPQPLSPLVDALRRGDMQRAGRLLLNRLQPAAASLSPWIGRLQGEFGRWDFLGHGMTGSGTSYFGLCRHARHARRIAGRLRASRLGSVFAVRSCR
jgi:4-diphosphocytidyl-2-C-methyl-D-erythritol kinase